MPAAFRKGNRLSLPSTTGYGCGTESREGPLDEKSAFILAYKIVAPPPLARVLGRMLFLL